MSESGIFDLSHGDYHGGPTDEPCLSASIAHILVTRSPLHAWTAHPKLNPGYERVEDPKFDVGTVAHAVLLEGRDIVYVIHADDWRTKASKEERDYARSLGKIPLLARHRDEVEAMVSAVRDQLAAHDAEPPLFADGKPEQTLVWQEGDVLCKARLDWLRSDFLAVDDLKTTGRSANPEAYARRLYDIGGDVQAAFYLRGVEKLTGATPEFRWVVCETSPPYALSVVAPGPDVIALGAAKVEWALAKWRHCMTTGEWPGYARQVATAELPPWEESRWLERELREVA